MFDVLRDLSRVELRPWDRVIIRVIVRIRIRVRVRVSVLRVFTSWSSDVSAHHKG